MTLPPAAAKLEQEVSTHGPLGSLKGSLLPRIAPKAS